MNPIEVAGAMLVGAGVAMAFLLLFKTTVTGPAVEPRARDGQNRAQITGSARADALDAVPAGEPPEPTDDEIEAARVAWERFGTALTESGLRAKIVDVLRAAYAVRGAGASPGSAPTQENTNGEA